MINGCVSSPGDIREEELFKALVRRFGKNCVYRSPKVRVHGQEKELGDVVVLVLPYMIVFQSKWKKLTGDDLRGDRGEVYRTRLIRTMHEAAGQFNELASSLQQKMTIELPQVWFPGNEATYQFPLERIEHVVPVVVVDFEDAQYDNPDERFEDIPPVITDVPSQIKSWGMVHSFLLRNFYRILEQLFTVGDLLYWLQEREKMIGTNTRSIIGYSELTLFAIYLENNGLWGDLLKADCVTLTDNDGLERRIKKRKKAFAERQKIFGQRNLLDVIDDTIVRFLAQTDIEHRNDVILSYLDCQGRLPCCSAKTKRETALRLHPEISVDEFAYIRRHVRIISLYDVEVMSARHHGVFDVLDIYLHGDESRLYDRSFSLLDKDAESLDVYGFDDLMEYAEQGIKGLFQERKSA